MLSSLAYSEVGINNESPKATLAVTAKTTDGSEGIIYANPANVTLLISKSSKKKII